MQFKQAELRRRHIGFRCSKIKLRNPYDNFLGMKPMIRKELMSYDQIKKGFMSTDRERERHGRKADFKVKKIGEAPNKFDNECLCQNDVFNAPTV